MLKINFKGEYNYISQSIQIHKTLMMEQDKETNGIQLLQCLYVEFNSWCHMKKWARCVAGPGRFRVVSPSLFIHYSSKSLPWLSAPYFIFNTNNIFTPQSTVVFFFMSFWILFLSLSWLSGLTRLYYFKCALLLLKKLTIRHIYSVAHKSI